MIPDGVAGALAELERRKFTAEEGVGILFAFHIHALMYDFQDHFTLLNGKLSFNYTLVKLLSFHQPTMLLQDTAALQGGVNRTLYPSEQCLEQFPSDRS